MAEFNPVPGLGVIGTAVSIGLGMSQWGGRRGRYYAMPVTGTLIIFGLDWFYDFPVYAYLAGIIFAPFLFHRSLQAKLVAASKKIADLPLPELGIKLMRVPDAEEHRIARWAAEELPADAKAPRTDPLLRQGGILAEAPGVDLARATAGPHTLVLLLDFHGEGDDE